MVQESMVPPRSRNSVAISPLRTQPQQWVTLGVTLADGRPCTRELYRQFRNEEAAQLAATAASTARLQRSAELLDHLVLGNAPEEFLTLPAYEQLR